MPCERERKGLCQDAKDAQTRGTIKGGAAGAVLGFIVGGPVGAAIGTAVGGIVGGDMERESVRKRKNCKCKND